jgi:hypothetical protein
MQHLEIWYCKNDLIVNIAKHVQFHVIPNKTDILVDLTSYLIAMKLHTVQNYNF